MHVDGCFHSFFDVFAAGADFRISRGITSVQSVTNWKHFMDEFEKGGVGVGVFHCECHKGCPSQTVGSSVICSSCCDGSLSDRLIEINS